MTNWIAWYFVTSALGWMAFPVTFRLLGGLKDRGYMVSRITGLLIWGFCFWLLASLGILPNNTGGHLFSAGLLFALTVWSLSGGHGQEIKDWLRSQRRLVITGEILFLVSFATWAIVRAANPEAVGTEKPMELAFINAIMRSSTFPPHDPWLSGYAISYYYFGYVLTAMLAMVTRTSGGVAFNLGVALIFALSACGAYGLVYNLLNIRKSPNTRGTETGKADEQELMLSDKYAPPRHTLSALLGPLYVLIVSNLEGFLDVLHSAGLFWHRNVDGTLSSAFWKWLDIQDLVNPPMEPLSINPNRFWWWWRASRVLQDYDLKGGPREIIDEFPFFSYLLADLHPHVLAMPFAFLAISLALNVFLNNGMQMQSGLKIHFPKVFVVWGSLLVFPVGLAAVISGVMAQSVGLLGVGVLTLFGSVLLLWRAVQTAGDKDIEAIFFNQGEITIHLELAPDFLLLAGVALGAMAFLNTWDFPVYVFIFAGAYALRQVFRNGKNWEQALVDLILVGAILGVGGVILYLPFYLGFASQAGGILPNLIFPTRGAQFWVMFAPLLIPIFGYLLYYQGGEEKRKFLWKGLAYSGAALLGLGIISLLMGWGITFIPERGEQFLGSLAANSSNELIRTAFIRRLTTPGTWITLLVILGLSLSLFFRISEKYIREEKQGIDNTGVTPSTIKTVTPQPNGFVLLLIFTGLMLVLVPEFFFLLDMFGWRMNTIFKFYFSAWLIWGIAAAFCIVNLSQELKGLWNGVMRVVVSLVVLMSLVYPLLSLLDKTNNFRPSRWTLDSTAYFAHENPDEKAAIEWLKQAPFGVIAEAVPVTGGSYTGSARMSTQSGMPTVLGWVGHENQWRGGNQLSGTRQSDLERLYCSRDWDEIKMILDQYQVRYVIVGNLERSTYKPNNGLCPSGLAEAKFELNLTPVFSLNNITIYEYAGLQQHD